MDSATRKEQLSHAYVRAVASAAGCSVDRPEVDRDSVDLMLKGYDTGGPIAYPRLDLQLKCSSREVMTNDEIRFPVKRKNYDDLRKENVLVPRLLVVVLVPEEVGRWLFQSEEEMLVRHCAYWRSLRGMPESPNDHSVTVRIPRGNLFDVAILGELMRRVSQGDKP